MQAKEAQDLIAEALAGSRPLEQVMQDHDHCDLRGLERARPIFLRKAKNLSKGRSLFERALWAIVLRLHALVQSNRRA